jgi:hypothetical protein
MPCGCNSICDNDCSVNQLCTGNEPVCSNSYSFTSISAGDIVRASHLTELQAAINAERINAGRRYNAGDPTYAQLIHLGMLLVVIMIFQQIHLIVLMLVMRF